ncbi:hypothetical protein LguiA_033535 [Lonicera macranthoides]
MSWQLCMDPVLVESLLHFPLPARPEQKILTDRHTCMISNMLYCFNGVRGSLLLQVRCRHGSGGVAGMLAGGAAAAAAAYGAHHLTHGSGAGGGHYVQGAYGGHYGGVGHGHGKVKHGKFKHGKFGKHKKHGFKKWK